MTRQIADTTVIFEELKRKQIDYLLDCINDLKQKNTPEEQLNKIYKTLLGLTSEDWLAFLFQEKKQPEKNEVCAVKMEDRSREEEYEIPMFDVNNFCELYFDEEVCRQNEEIRKEKETFDQISIYKQQEYIYKKMEKYITESDLAKMKAKIEQALKKEKLSEKVRTVLELLLNHHELLCRTVFVRDCSYFNTVYRIGPTYLFNKSKIPMYDVSGRDSIKEFLFRTAKSQTICLCWDNSWHFAEEEANEY